MKTNGEYKKTFGPGKTTEIIPKGLRVIEITRGSAKGKYFLDEFPYEIFPLKSLIRSDAVHYGIVFEKNEVEQ